MIFTYYFLLLDNDLAELKKINNFQHQCSLPDLDFDTPNVHIHKMNCCLFWTELFYVSIIEYRVGRQSSRQNRTSAIQQQQQELLSKMEQVASYGVCALCYLLFLFKMQFLSLLLQISASLAFRNHTFCVSLPILLIERFLLNVDDTKVCFFWSAKVSNGLLQVALIYFRTLRK